MDFRNTGTAVILAGGKSRRFGRDKAFIDFNGRPLIEHIITGLEPLFDEIIISTNEPDKYKHLDRSACRDVIRKIGPLAGVHAGLRAASGEWAFVTACDMPFMSSVLINRMRRMTAGTPATAVVPGRAGFIEPFHGFYSKKLVPLIEQKTAAGSCGIFALLKQTTTEIVACSDERIFLNINKPEDLQKITFPIR